MMKVYSVFDSKAEAYAQPQFFHNRALALRGWMTAIENKDSEIHRYASDYTLFEIGEWNEFTGTFVAYEVKENLGLASEWLARAAT